MMMAYEENAKKWILENVETLNRLWKYRDDTYMFKRAFSADGEVKIDAGMTRIVIIGEDFVIKINKPITDRWRRFGSCRDEVKMYKKAIKDGYAWLFCPIRAMVIEHHTYYIMQKVDCTAEEAGYDENIEDAFYDYLGEEVIDYLQANVFDIHSENFGLINDEPVIFDYAANYC